MRVNLRPLRYDAAIILPLRRCQNREGSRLPRKALTAVEEGNWKDGDIRSVRASLGAQQQASAIPTERRVKLQCMPLRI